MDEEIELVQIMNPTRSSSFSTDSQHVSSFHSTHVSPPQNTSYEPNTLPPQFALEYQHYAQPTVNGQGQYCIHAPFPVTDCSSSLQEVYNGDVRTTTVTITFTTQVARTDASTSCPSSRSTSIESQPSYCTAMGYYNPPAGQYQLHTNQCDYTSDLLDGFNNDYDCQNDYIGDGYSGYQTECSTNWGYDESISMPEDTPLSEQDFLVLSTMLSDVHFPDSM